MRVVSSRRRPCLLSSASLCVNIDQTGWLLAYNWFDLLLMCCCFVAACQSYSSNKQAANSENSLHRSGRSLLDGGGESGSVRQSVASERAVFAF